MEPDLTLRECRQCGKPSLAAMVEHICEDCADVYVFCPQCAEGVRTPEEIEQGIKRARVAMQEGDEAIARYALSSDRRLREVADIVAEKVRLKKGGEVVRYTRAVLEALTELGYRVSPTVVGDA